MGFPLGFWFTQQGAMLVYISLIFIYHLWMKRIEHRHGVAHHGRVIGLAGLCQGLLELVGLRILLGVHLRQETNKPPLATDNLLEDTGGLRRPPLDNPSVPSRCGSPLLLLTCSSSDDVIAF